MKINVHVAVLSFTWTFSLVCATGSPRPSDADQKKVHVFLALKINDYEQQTKTNQTDENSVLCHLYGISFF